MSGRPIKRTLRARANRPTVLNCPDQDFTPRIPMHSSSSLSEVYLPECQELERKWRSPIGGGESFSDRLSRGDLPRSTAR